MEEWDEERSGGALKCGDGSEGVVSVVRCGKCGEVWLGVMCSEGRWKQKRGDKIAWGSWSQVDGAVNGTSLHTQYGPDWLH